MVGLGWKCIHVVVETFGAGCGEKDCDTFQHTSRLVSSEARDVWQTKLDFNVGKCLGYPSKIQLAWKF